MEEPPVVFRLDALPALGVPVFTLSARPLPAPPTRWRRVLAWLRATLRTLVAVGRARLLAWGLRGC